MSTRGSVFPDVAVEIDAADTPVVQAQSPTIQSFPSREQSPEWETRYGSTRSIDLFRAGLSGDWEAVEEISKEDPTWLQTGITKGRETVLHIAAASKHLRMVEEIIKIDPSSLLYTNADGSTPFCFAAVSGDVKIAEAMVKQNNELPTIRSGEEMTPLLMAVLLGLEDMVWYLLKVTDEKHLTDRDHIEILTCCIDTDLFDVALHVLKKNLSLAFLRNSKGETALHALARKPLKQGGYPPSIWRMMLQRGASRGNKEPSTVIELTETIWKQVITQKQEHLSESIRLPWRLLFVAARLGKVEFLTVLIRSYPDLIWKVDENRYSIFHIAIICRQAEIFKLIYEIGAIKDLIATYKDSRRNNMLHLACKLPPPEHLNCVTGAVLQMQRELQWFEAIKQLVRSDYSEAENEDKQTPQALFSKEHEELRKQGEEWMKKTAESCALVAALIATMVFTTAYQLPGGLNSDNGNEKGSPVLVKTPSFQFYAMANATSLFSSTASILMFLSILTSRYAERDFLKSLPVKLMTGLILLLVSMATMIMSFTTTLFITFQEGLKWPPITIALFATVPVLLFALQQFPLLIEMYTSTYISRAMFSRGKEKVFESPSRISLLRPQETKGLYHSIIQKLNLRFRGPTMDTSSSSSQSFQNQIPSRNPTPSNFQKTLPSLPEEKSVELFKQEKPTIYRRDSGICSTVASPANH